MLGYEICRRIYERRRAVSYCMKHRVIFYAQIERCYMCKKEAEDKCKNHDFKPWHDMRTPQGIYEIRSCKLCGYGEERKKK